MQLLQSLRGLHAPTVLEPCRGHVGKSRLTCRKDHRPRVAKPMCPSHGRVEQPGFLLTEGTPVSPVEVGRAQPRSAGPSGACIVLSKAVNSCSFQPLSFEGHHSTTTASWKFPNHCAGQPAEPESYNGSVWLLLLRWCFSSQCQRRSHPSSYLIARGAVFSVS